MNMTSRFTLLAGVAGLIWAGCSAPAEDGAIPDPPTVPPPGIGGAGPVATAGTGGGGTGGAPVQSGGTGGAPVTSGGTGGAPVGGTGGGGGAGGGGSIPTGTGLALTHAADGWVAGSTNAVGIQGSFYPYGDYQAAPPGDTTAELGDLSTASTVCISGVASQVLTPDGAAEPAYGQYYGGGVALNLADAGGMTGPGPWSRGAVTGFSFTITGQTIPPNLRFVATAGGAGAASYCADDITTAGQTTITLSTLVTNCWEAGGTLLPATQTLEAIQWQVVTVVDASTPFDFCIENLTAITAP